MEEKKIVNYKNEKNLKNLIANIINKQIGLKLKNLEQKNDTEIKELNQISKLSKEYTNTLLNYSNKINKKIYEQKKKMNQRQAINNSKLRKFSPSNMSFKKGINRKNVNNNHNNINNINLRNNLMSKRSLTPLNNFNTIVKKNNIKYKRDIKTPSKPTRKSKNTDNFDTQSKCSYFTHVTNKKKNKTPVRKKNKIYFKKIAKTPEKSSKNKRKMDFDLASLDNDIEITKMSINPDDNQERISNELYNINNIRLTIKLGALAEKIENEKLLIDDDIFSTTSDNFYKSIEYIYDYLFAFLDIKSFFNIIMVNKSYFHLIIKLMISKLENKIKNINNYLTDLRIQNKSLNLKEEKIKAFEYNNSSIRALSILNSLSVDNFFSEKKINFSDKNISLIFDLYFISIGKKKDIITCNYENGYREKYIMKYFKNNNKNKIGNILDNEFKKINFTDEIINSLYEYSYNKLNIISPKNFQRVNKNITWFCYLIKNIIEHIGIISKDNNKNIKQIYNVYCSRLNINKELIKKLKMLLDLY